MNVKEVAHFSLPAQDNIKSVSANFMSDYTEMTTLYLRIYNLHVIYKVNILNCTNNYKGYYY